METLFLGIDIAGWLQGTGIVVLAGIVVTILRKKGLILNIKRFFGTMSKVTEEIGEAFLASSNAFESADEAIKDDGRLRESNVKDVIAAGKKAVIEWNDVVMIVKPKKKK